MNQRIRLLAKQAGMWRQHYDIGLESPAGLEKFAQLIEEAAEKKYFSAGYIAGQSVGISETVRACVDIVNGLSQHQGPGDCSTAEYIREHFGVES